MNDPIVLMLVMGATRCMTNNMNFVFAGQMGLVTVCFHSSRSPCRCALLLRRRPPIFLTDIQENGGQLLGKPPTVGDQK